MKHVIVLLSILLFSLFPPSLFAQDITTLSVSTDPLNPTTQSAIAGETTAFLVTVANTGATDALQPKLTDNIVNPLPDGAQVVEFSLVRGGNNFDYDVQGGERLRVVSIVADGEGGNRPSAHCSLTPPMSPDSDGTLTPPPLPVTGERFNLLCRLDAPLEPVQTIQASALTQHLAPDAGSGRWVVQVGMIAAQPLHIDSVVDVSSSDVDLNPNNNVDTGQQPVACTEPASANGNVDLALDVLLTGAESMGDLPTVVTGSTVTFTLQTTNYTRQSAVCAQLVEVVPTRTRFNAAASTPGWNCADGAPAGTVCTYALYVAPSGIMQAVDFAVTIDSFTTGGELTSNVVALEDDGQDRNRSNNDDTMKLLIVMPVRNWFPMIHR